MSEETDCAQRKRKPPNARKQRQPHHVQGQRPGRGPGLSGTPRATVATTPRTAASTSRTKRPRFTTASLITPCSLVSTISARSARVPCSTPIPIPRIWNIKVTTFNGTQVAFAKRRGKRELVHLRTMIMSMDLSLDGIIDDYPIGRRERGKRRLQLSPAGRDRQGLSHRPYDHEQARPLVCSQEEHVHEQRHRRREPR